MTRFVLFLCLVLSAACTSESVDGGSTERGNGIEGSVELETTGIRSLDLRTFVDVDITVGGEESATLRCDENLLPFIEMVVSGSALVVRNVPNVSLSPTLPCTIDFVVAATFEAVSTSGSGDITSTASLDAIADMSSSGSGDIDLAVAGGADVLARATGAGDIAVGDLRAMRSVDASSSGAGDVSLRGLTVTEVFAQASGAGDVLLSGAADVLEFTVSGAGDLDASDLATVDADVRLTAAGSAEVRASGTVVGTVSGSGSLTVLGGADVNVTATGSGDVVER